MQYLMHIKQRGFTLIELVMVVVILGVVAGFAIPNYTKTVSRSHEKSAMNNLIILYGAQQLQKNSGNGFKRGANLAILNTALGIGIVDTYHTYTCGCSTGAAACNTASTQFSCNARRGASYRLLITNMSANPTAVCCESGTCPTAAAASGTPPTCP